MKRLFAVVMVLVATGCGSTGTDSSGTSDDDDDGSSGFNCSSFTPGAGIICDSSTTPPTIRVDFGTGAGQAVQGDDPRLAAINPDKGKYIASFVPSGTEAPAGANTVNPGVAGALLIKNEATQRVGIRAADELCKAKNPTHANAHVCTNEEIIWNVRNGFITAPANGVAIGSHQDPGTGGARSSFKGNCGMLTYNSGDLAYTGTRWEAVTNDPKDATMNDSNATVVNFVPISCATTGTPIACCQ